ncbi:DUF6286 domain-containing protein [Kitasatospora sp. NPDC002227]|uniref:DUF6286 domain-containing protein n=1 Tax=Kitasatospora sp. NPDC002227 TaxID=3154773 RepID=UPI0033309DD6
MTPDQADDPPQDPPARPPVQPADGSLSSTPPEPASGGHRPRSARTGVTGLVVLAVLVVAAGLLWDVVAVRTGHQARRWRAEAAHQVAVRELSDTWVLVGAGAAVVVGAGLVWLAFAAGLRRWLPLGVGDGTAAVDRAGVAAVIRGRAHELPEVTAATVKVRQARTTVTIRGTADPAAVQRELREELAQVPLARPHRLDVRTHRADR